MGQADNTNANDLWVSTFELKNKSRKKTKQNNICLGLHKNRIWNTNAAKEALHDKGNDIAWANTRFWHRTLLKSTAEKSEFLIHWFKTSGESHSVSYSGRKFHELNKEQTRTVNLMSYRRDHMQNSRKWKKHQVIWKSKLVASLTTSSSF